MSKVGPTTPESALPPPPSLSPPRRVRHHNPTRPLAQSCVIVPIGAALMDSGIPVMPLGRADHRITHCIPHTFGRAHDAMNRIRHDAPPTASPRQSPRNPGGLRSADTHVRAERQSIRVEVRRSRRASEMICEPLPFVQCSVTSSLIPFRHYHGSSTRSSTTTNPVVRQHRTGQFIRYRIVIWATMVRTSEDFRCSFVQSTDHFLLASPTKRARSPGSSYKKLGRHVRYPHSTTHQVQAPPRATRRACCFGLGARNARVVDSIHHDAPGPVPFDAARRR